MDQPTNSIYYKNVSEFASFSLNKRLGATSDLYLTRLPVANILKKGSSRYMYTVVNSRPGQNKKRKSNKENTNVEN